MTTFNASIPLHCSICPKRPTFSDVSHLLTHIASKGHLSHYYKIKVRSGNEEASRRTIETYDRWYADWGVEDLMSDRMSLKEKKRTRARASNSGRGRQASSAPQDQLRRKAANTLDPRLSEHLVKDEPSPTPPPGFGDRSFAPSFAPRMQRWPSPYTASTYSNGYDGSDIFTEQSEPLSRAVTPPSLSFLPQLADNAADDTTVNEASKLKGIYWPGMDIFDSATPEMKRKRNQKKDVSVVEQLEVNSQEVEPTESIWTPFGTLRKQRLISGSVTDSSPIKLDPSPRRGFLDREALVDLDVNQPRRRRRSPRKRRRAQSLYDEDEPVGQMAMGTNTKRKKEFDVFRDNDEVTFDRPAGMDLLTSEFHPLPQADPSPPFDFGRPYLDPFHPSSYEGFGFDYQQPASCFTNGLPYQQPQSFQAAAQQDISNFFDNQFAQTNAAWMNNNNNDNNNNNNNHNNSNNPFNQTADDFKPQVEDEYDDGRTITAPPSDNA